MNASSRELLVQAQRSARARPRLVDAVVGYRAAPYFWYRIRFIVPRVILRTFLHGLEIFLLSRLVPFEAMGPFLLWRGISILSLGFHWGWLEGLRHQVRILYRRKRLRDLRSVARTWIERSAGFGAIVIAGACLWMGLNLDGFDSFSVFDAFALATGVRVLLESVARTYHAMVYSVRRVHRPLSSLLLPDAVEPIALILLFPAWGLWSFAMVVLLGGTLRAWLTVQWTRRSIRGTRLAGTLRRRTAPVKMEKGPSTLRTGLASLTGQIDALILILLIQASEPAIAGIFYVLRPLLAGVHGAFRTYYFDFKLLMDVCPEILLRSFKRRLQRLAVALGIVSGILMAVLSLAWMPSAFWSVLLSFVALGVSRSLFSLSQVESFAEEAYDALIATTVVLGALVMGVSLVSHTLFWLSLELAVALTCAAFALRFFCVRDKVHHFVERFSSWIPRVAHTPSPLLVITAQIDKQTKVTRRVIFAILRTYCPRGFLSPEGKSRFVLCLPGIEQAEAQGVARDLRLHAAGTLRSFQSHFYRDGKEAFQSWTRGEASVLSELRRNELQLAMSEPPIEVRSFLNALKAELPDLQILRPGSPVIWDPCWSRERLSSIIGLQRVARAQRVYSCVFPHTGDKRSVLLLCYPTSENSKVLKKWASLIEKQVLAHALLSLRGPNPQVGSNDLQSTDSP